MQQDKLTYGLETEVVEKIQLVFERFAAIDQVILYGSRAKGNYKHGSDIDLTLKGKNLDLSVLNEVNLALDELQIPYSFDISVYTQINNADLLEHIDRVGIVFYERWRETNYGIIDKKWEFIPATEFCLKITDGTHDSPKQQLEGKHLITSKHLKDREIDFSNAYLISEDDFNKINIRSRVDQWDVIISMIGEYCGFCYIERNENIDYAVKNVGLFKTGSKEKALWLYYFLNSRIGRSIIEENKSGSSQPYLTLNFLRSLNILVPKDSKIQVAIIDTLSSLDDKIALLHRQNKTLEELAETLFQKRFVEDAGEDWEETNLFNTIKLVGGGTPKTSVNEYWNGVYNWLSGGDIATNHKKFIITSEKTITESGLINSSAKLLPKYSTVISARGTVGKYGLLAKPMAYSQSNYGVMPNYKDCFFFTYLLIANSVDGLQSAAYGSVFDTITTNTFKEQAIALPPTKTIERFEEEVKPYFFKMESNQNQINTLIQLRDSLLPKLMIGDVKIIS